MYLICNGLLCKQYYDHVKKVSQELQEASLQPDSTAFSFSPMIFAYFIPASGSAPAFHRQQLPVEYIQDPKYHSIHKNDLARAMVAQSEQAFLAIAQGNAPKEATVKILEFKEMEPFFVKGESAEP